MFTFIKRKIIWTDFKQHRKSFFYTIMFHVTFKQGAWGR